MAEPYYQDDQGVTLYHGDCIEVMRTLPDNSVHAVVTDPPYGIRFMGSAWDGADIVARQQRGKITSPMPAGVGGPNGGYRSVAAEAGRYNPGENVAFQEWCREWSAECFRILKPGGHLLASGSPRTSHRLASGIEDAGFEIRDSIAWLYGQGFPKSLDVSKAIDKAAGAERAVVGAGTSGVTAGMQQLGPSGIKGGNYDITASATPDAARWQGWGTALKPAFEPIVVGRKPLGQTVAANVMEHGTGALNIDATRIHAVDAPAGRTRHGGGIPGNGSSFELADPDGESPAGRWPTNVLLDGSQAEALDVQSGVLTSGVMKARTERAATRGGTIYGAQDRNIVSGDTYGDTGGASRFFPTFHYEAKAPGTERPDVDGVQHPTVKPLDLMRWLVRLVASPGATILEPFAGSGTTLEACLIEGFNVIGIEREADYLPLIMQRITKPLQQSLFGDIA